MLNQKKKGKQAYENFNVIVRIRPFLSFQDKKQYIIINQQQIKLLSAKFSQHNISQNNIYQFQQTKIFQYDKIINAQQSNQQVFEFLNEKVATILEGKNISIMTYGASGAGKTYTMFGKGNLLGLSQLLIKKIFNNNNYNSNQAISFIQIYNQKAIDLLNTKNDNLSVNQDEKGVHITNLKKIKFRKLQQIQNLFKIANSKRTIGHTKTNQTSSRSHAIIQIQYQFITQNEILYSKVLLADLAGNQRMQFDSTNNRLRYNQGVNINKSLHALGNCINILSDSNKIDQFIPYRDSKLTRILKDSLTGNTSSIMICCISPSFDKYSQTLNSLRYASKIKLIKKVVLKNVYKESKINNNKYNYQDFFLQQTSPIKLLQVSSCVQNTNWDDKKSQFFKLIKTYTNNLTELIEYSINIQNELIRTQKQIQTNKIRNNIKQSFFSKLINDDSQKICQKLEYLKQEKLKIQNQKNKVQQYMYNQYMKCFTNSIITSSGIQNQKVIKLKTQLKITLQKLNQKQKELLFYRKNNSKSIKNTTKKQRNNSINKLVPRNGTRHNKNQKSINYHISVRQSYSTAKLIRPKNTMNPLKTQNIQINKHQINKITKKLVIPKQKNQAQNNQSRFSNRQILDNEGPIYAAAVFKRQAIDSARFKQQMNENQQIEKSYISNGTNYSKEIKQIILKQKKALQNEKYRIQTLQQLSKQILQ